MKVLVVDDNAINRKLLRVTLTTGGHQAVEAADGLEALERLAEGGFDAVISDILMPRMDGYRLCYEMRRDEDYRPLPIIIYSSTYLTEADERLALSVGADRFIRKPAGAEVILGALAQLQRAEPSRPEAVRPTRDLETLKEYSEGLVRKLEERNYELEASEQRYRALFELSPLPMWVYDPETLAIQAVNAAAVEHYGYARDELLAMTLKDIRPAEEIPRLLGVDRSVPGRRAAGLWKHRKKDGSLIDVDVYTHEVVLGGQPLRLAVLRDVTEQRMLEEQFRQAQKMEAIGRMAAGIAHDFNNLLTVIVGYSELISKQVGKHGPFSQELAEIRKAGERAGGLTRQLLAFSRKQVLMPEVLDLNAVVIDLEDILRRVLGEDLELRAVLDPGLGHVKADPSQVEQVIMNLAVNARDAMPEGGRLTLETRNVELDEDYAREHATVQPGSYVMLAVSDTGTGMDETTRSRIFEPFYTTKEPGKGTGLGLSTTYGIVKQSGGSIWVYSELGRGTTFKIYLPRVDEPLAPAREPETRDAPAGGAQRAAGYETVLIAEDDDAIRLLARLALERHGYSVLMAKDGAEALEVTRGHRGPIHVLVTDMLMPGMNGTELAAQVTALRPGLKVLFVSGYAEGTVMGEGEMAERSAFLEKPFTTEALARKVRQLLGG
jgi:two-component system, cell cycle sensor histidine kinase and response regulator CckA